jgi:hypothetical protein
MSESIKTSRGTLSITTGSEGPKHDPYGFIEYHAKGKGGKEVTLHQGLGDYLKVGQVRLEVPKGKSLTEVFKEETGLDPHKVERWHAKRPLRCKCKEGKPQLEWTPGYPGEHFLMCRKCGDILDSTFNKSEIE